MKTAKLCQVINRTSIDGNAMCIGCTHGETVIDQSGKELILCYNEYAIEYFEKREIIARGKCPFWKPETFNEKPNEMDFDIMKRITDAILLEIDTLPKCFLYEL